MIRGFKDAKTEEVFHGRCPKGFPASLLKVARRKLAMLHAAFGLEDLTAVPGNKLHALKGDRKGQYAIWVNNQFRICFEWSDAGASNVEIADYHDE
jgi:proteic killer suppression protein